VSGGDKRAAVVPRGPLIRIDEWSEKDSAADRERQIAFQQGKKA